MQPISSIPGFARTRGIISRRLFSLVFNLSSIEYKVNVHFRGAPLMTLTYVIMTLSEHLSNMAEDIPPFPQTSNSSLQIFSEETYSSCFEEYILSL